MASLRSVDLHLLERLGGSTATVHRATVGTTGRVVVVKRAPWDRPDVADRLGREAAVLRRVTHRSLVRLLDVVEDLEGRTLILAHAPGGSLAARIARHGPRPAADAADLGARLADALSSLHGAGIVHRDVHPGNVLIDAELQPLLADLEHALDGGSSRLPADGDVVGHPDHVDHRLFAGHEVNPGTDLHGLATTVWAAVTGAPPQRARPQDPVELPHDPAVPPHLHAVLAACLTAEIGDAVTASGELEAVATALGVRSGTSTPPGDLPLRPVGPDPSASGTRSTPPLVAGRVATERGTRNWGPRPEEARPSAPVTTGRRTLVRVAAALLVVLGIGAALWLTRHVDGPRTTPVAAEAPRPCDVAASTDVVLADLDGDGCSEMLQLVDGQLLTPLGRYQLGRRDDVLLAGDWDADGRWGVGLYRPSTGAVYLFDTAGPGVRSRPAQQFAVHGSPMVVSTPDGHRVTVSPNA